jgi:hypothetical protein
VNESALVLALALLNTVHKSDDGIRWEAHIVRVGTLHPYTHDILSNMKRLAQGVIIVIFFGGIALLWQAYAKPATPTTPSPSEEPQGSTLADAWIEVPVITTTRTEESMPTLRYTWSTSYPVVELLGHQKEARAVNDIIRTFTLDIVDAFRRGVEPETDIILAQDGTSDLALHSSTLLASPTHVSFQFDTAEYYSGAAHPNHFARMLTIDMEHGTMVRPEEFFASSSAGVEFLSRATREILRERFMDDEDTLRTMTTPGTAPLWENFRNVGLTPLGLVVVFDPYHVAPYARGPQVVRIPSNTISALLTPRIRDAMTEADTNIAHAVAEGM